MSEANKPMSRLTITGLKKNFEDVCAIENLSLVLEDREFMVLVGPTGCGKSTLLRLIAGVEDEDSGHIYLDGVRLNGIPPGRRGVQLVFQSYALWPHLKVFDGPKYSNLSFALKVRRWLPGILNERVQDVMRRLEISRKWSRRCPDSLSAGQQQKVAVGRAIAIPPQVLLLDEPLANIDPVARLEVRKELRRTHDEIGALSLLVTHDLTDAFQIADRIAVMRDGAIIQVDTPENLINHPLDSFVENFFTSVHHERLLQEFRMRRTTRRTRSTPGSP